MPGLQARSQLGVFKRQPIDVSLSPTLPLPLKINNYIYMYMCVCVCVCVYAFNLQDFALQQAQGFSFPQKIQKTSIAL